MAYDFEIHVDFDIGVSAKEDVNPEICLLRGEDMEAWVEPSLTVFNCIHGMHQWI